ncbi:MAG: UDP-N-acetylmuramate--L-alanine ligase [Akkermansia sp.]
MIEELRQRLLDREHPARVHLIGVAGSGMSGIALILLEMGHLVSGSDRVSSAETERLQGLGLMFSTPHTAVMLDDVELVIYSSAIRSENETLSTARSRHIPCYRRAECLAAVLNAKKGVIVSGTHGKTTTSALSAHLLREGRMRPCHYVGAEIPVLGANAHWNEKSEYLVAEGDESDGTLVNYIPEHSIVLNIEAEHLDFYRDLDHIKSVFDRLCSQTRGKIFYCAVDAGASAVCSKYANAVSYGWSDADFMATDVREMRGHSAFNVVKRGELLGRVELGIPGRHNVLNALAAIALVMEIGVDFGSVSRGLASFAGAKRRFETKYLSPAFRIVDDYGHHPTEIAATLQTARSLNPKRLIVLFQPHRYTRTKMLADDFGKVLQVADIVYVADVYPASELPIEGVTGQLIVDAIHRHGPVPSTFIPDLTQARYAVGNILEPGDLFLTLGAGNVHEEGAHIAKDLSVLEEMERFADHDVKGCLYESMKSHTTMGVGGCAQYWIEPSNFESMSGIVNYCRERSIPVRMLGRGTNAIVRDGGIRGVVVHPSGGDFDKIEIGEEQTIEVGAGIRLKKLASVAIQAGIAGFEWMDGIPGNVGGSLRMNAGAMGSDMWSNFISAICLDDDGQIREHTKEQMEVQYRSIPELINNFVMSAKFRGAVGDVAQMQRQVEASREKRKTTQPSGASSGCIFKNPEEIPAGKLVEQLGLKGTSIGGAAVSEIHGNFIINTGKACARDVTELMDLIRAKALEQRQIQLSSEAQVIGDRESQF